MSGSVQILALGELVVTIDGVPVAVGPAKQRALLGLLLCRPDVEQRVELDLDRGRAAERHAVTDTVCENWGHAPLTSV